MVTVAGLVLGFVANQLSPRGIVLARDYFPPVPAVPPAPAASAGSVPSAPPGGAAMAAPDTAPVGTPESQDTGPASSSPEKVPDAVATAVRARGWGVVERADAEALFHDPRYAQESVVFVDARDDRHYLEGHIPGARPLDRFYPERYLPDLLGPCLAAERVVVYCSGGDCDDSLFAAALLAEAGVPADRLAVYVGGMREWQAGGLPVEVGGRHSGNLSTTAEAPAGGTP